MYGITEKCLILENNNKWTKVKKGSAGTEKGE
jgi:hypothetical protein